MRKVMWFAIGFTASCIMGVYLLSGSILGWLALIFGLLAVGSFFIKPTVVKIVGTVFLGLSVGLVWNWGYQSLYLNQAREFEGQLLMKEIEATDYSRITDYGGSVDGKVQLGNKRFRVRVYYDEPKSIKPGDTVCGVFAFGMTTPDGAEESDYYQGKGIFLIATAEGAVSVRSASKVPAKYFPTRMRHGITDILNKAFPKDTLGFARALLLGDSSLLTYQEDTAFKVSGIRHIVAVSGLHISILFALVYKFTMHRRVLTAAIGIPALILFAAIAGFTPSINRACTMQILMILALLLDEEYDPPTALALSVLMMLFINPMTITSVSFQLSVGCMIGIFLFSQRTSDYILRKLGKPDGRTKKGRVAYWFSHSVSVSLSAMTVTTPLVAWYFGVVSLVSVLTNLLTLWLVSFIFYGIMLACVMGWVWLPLGKIVAWVISWPVRLLLLTAKLLGRIPFAAVYTCSIYVVLWLCLCYVLFISFLFVKKKQPLILISCAAASLVAALTVSYIEPKTENMQVTVFDVGEGQSILLHSDNKNYLVDCGGSSGDKAADTVAAYLLSRGVFRLDGLILTHYDEDHTGGVEGLLSRVGTKMLYLPEIVDDYGVKERLKDQYSEKILWVNSDFCLTDEDSILSLITAKPDTDDENENSLCVLFQAENCDILITGDRNVSGEKALLSSYELPKLELLLAGHHGSASATNFELLSKTMPDLVAISCGEKYGHPTEALLSRLKMFGCDVWRTDRQGTLVFRR